MPVYLTTLKEKKIILPQPKWGFWQDINSTLYAFKKALQKLN